MDPGPQDYAAACEAAAMMYAEAWWRGQPPPPSPPPPPPPPIPPLPPSLYFYHHQALPPQFLHAPPYDVPLPRYAAHPPGTQPQELYQWSSPYAPPRPHHHMMWLYGPPPPPPQLTYQYTRPPAVLPPSNRRLKKRIDELVEGIAKNGPQFEMMIRDTHHDDLDFAFIFGGEGHAYYKHKLWVRTTPPPPPSYAPGSLYVMPPSLSMMMHVPPTYFGAHSHGEYEAAAEPGSSGSLPAHLAAELDEVISNLNGSDASIKGAQIWFMEWTLFKPALVEALRERLLALEDSEKQRNIFYMVNDIILERYHRRANIQDLDNEALAFQPVLGSMLASIYNNPECKDESKQMLENILQYWSSHEVYDEDTIANIESEMKSAVSSLTANQSPKPQITFSESSAQATEGDSGPDPYPLLPPGLIAAMEQEMEIGSETPYNPFTLGDTTPSTETESETLKHVT